MKMQPSHFNDMTLGKVEERVLGQANVNTFTGQISSAESLICLTVLPNNEVH